MVAQLISPSQLNERFTSDKQPTLIDVRTPMEFAQVHACGAVNMPLDKLDVEAVARDRDASAWPVYVICKSGKRAAKACDAFIAAGYSNIINVEGGTDAWIAANLPVERSNRKVMSLERQVRIAAGTLVLIGAVLAIFVNHWFVLISAFIGAGLVFAGITDFCGMGLLLAKAPWNRVCSDSCCGGKS